LLVDHVAAVGEQPIWDRAETDTILAAELEPTLQRLAKLAVLV
jgi:hypothetical protein